MCYGAFPCVQHSEQSGGAVWGLLALGMVGDEPGWCLMDLFILLQSNRDSSGVPTPKAHPVSSSFAFSFYQRLHPSFLRLHPDFIELESDGNAATGLGVMFFFFLFLNIFGVAV